MTRATQVLIRRLLRNIRKYSNIFKNIQKVALSDRLPARLAAYTFWSLLLLLLMPLLGAVALAVAVVSAFAVAVLLFTCFGLISACKNHISCRR